MHHKLFLGYLTEMFTEAHQQDLARENAVPIDLVIVDLYPFEEVIAKEGATFEDARGNIDVGGPSALRAAAKNFHRVMTIADYTQKAYDSLLTQLKLSSGHTSFTMRFRAHKVTFDILSQYDTAVAAYSNTVSYDDMAALYEIV